MNGIRQPTRDIPGSIYSQLIPCITVGSDKPFMERVMGIEPTLSAWEAEVLPLNYTRLQTARLTRQHYM